MRTLTKRARYTLNPSFRRHTLCASISSAQASSPCLTMHSSRTVRVAGQAQQILHVGFFSSVGAEELVGCSASGIVDSVEKFPAPFFTHRR